MWDPSLYQKAIKFAGEAHGDQRIPGSKLPYVVHLSNVCQEFFLAWQQAASFDINAAMCMALLHDCIEDAGVSYLQLKEIFGTPVADGVSALTKNPKILKADRMADSLTRIQKLQAPEAGIVKMADRITNLQEPPAFWPAEKRRAYQSEAREILERLSGRNTAIEQRLAKCIDEYARYIEG